MNTIFSPQTNHVVVINPTDHTVTRDTDHSRGHSVSVRLEVYSTQVTCLWRRKEDLRNTVVKVLETQHIVLDEVLLLIPRPTLRFDQLRLILNHRRHVVRVTVVRHGSHPMIHEPHYFHIFIQDDEPLLILIFDSDYLTGFLRRVVRLFILICEDEVLSFSFYHVSPSFG